MSYYVSEWILGQAGWFYKKNVHINFDSSDQHFFWHLILKPLKS